MPRLQQDVRDLLKAQGFDVTRHIMSEANSGLVSEMVGKLRPLLDQNRPKNPTREAEKYINAALVALIIKEQKTQRTKHKRTQKRISDAQEMHREEHEDHTQQALVEKQLSFFKSRKSEVTPTNIAMNDPRTPDKGIRQDSRENSAESILIISPSGQCFHDIVQEAREITSSVTPSKTIRSSLPTASGPDRLMRCIDSYQRLQEEVMTTFSHGVRANASQLMLIKKEMMEKDEELSNLRQQVATLQNSRRANDYSISDLGRGIAKLTNVVDGDYEGLRGQLINARVALRTIDRVFKDPIFQSRFVNTSLKRKRELGDSVTKEEDTA